MTTPANENMSHPELLFKKFGMTHAFENRDPSQPAENGCLRRHHEPVSSGPTKGTSMTSSRSS
jgi:hypothetical protein